LALQIESTIRIFFKKVYELNPRYESLRFGFMNPDLWVQTLRISKDSDLRICIFKDLFCAIVLRICKGLLDLWKKANLLKSVYESNPRTKSFESMFIQISNMIPASLNSLSILMIWFLNSIDIVNTKPLNKFSA
jgi:hypothetical protein